MSFMLLPPEVNSGRMYAGPGPGPMLAAAKAWDGLATELYSAVQQYGSAISELVADRWSGPSATAMENAAAPQVTWLSDTATQAERAADQARAAVSAYETAFATTVPPQTVAANRADYLMLVSTNIFGQNAPAIAVVEAQYAEMWAQDVAAMHGYAAASAVHSMLTPFSPPRQHTNAGALEAQGVAVAHAVGDAGGSHAQAVLSAGQQLLSAGPQALQGLASPTGPAALPAFLEWLYALQLPSGVVELQTFQQVHPITDLFLGLNWVHGLFGLSHSTYGLQEALVATGQVPSIPAEPGPLPLWEWEGMSIEVDAVSGELGEATTVGALSVPQGWVTEAPAMRLAAAALPMTSLDAVVNTGLFGGMSPLGLTPLVVMPGRDSRDEDADERESADDDGERRSAGE